MKINKSHFITQQNATVYQQAISNISFLNDHNYGMLPKTGTGNSPAIWLSIDNMQYVNIRIMNCLAITRGGYVIKLNAETQESADPMSAKIPGLSVPFSELKGRHEHYFIVLSVDPYNTVPAGAANPEEQPIRLPFTQPSYTISLMPQTEVSLNTLGEFQLPIGKVLVKDENVMLVEDYLPPCTAVNSHQKLIEHHAETEQFFGRMELNALQIVQKILQKNQQNDLIEPIKKMSEEVLSYISTVYARYRHTVRYSQPIELMAPVSGLARAIKNSLDIFMGTTKDDVISYFTEWCNVKQGELENEITDICNYQYDHINIHEGIEKNERFTSMILQLFTNLAALDYIGKKKEAGIFVKEKLVVAEEAQARKRGFFLAD